MRILPLGDSNTLGAGNPAIEIQWANGEIVPECLGKIVGYRKRLKELLGIAGVPSEFVGSKRAGWTSFADCKHDGWPGEGLDRIFQRVAVDNAMATFAPDVVLLLVGANDMWVNVASDRRPIDDARAAERVTKLARVLESIFASKPDVAVVVGKPSTPVGSERPLAIYRGGIDSLVASLRGSGKRIATMDTSGLPNDGVHYTPVGHEGLGERWAVAIKSLIAYPVPNPPPLPEPMPMGTSLSSAVVAPGAGDTNTEFVFSVQYADSNNAPPQAAYLVLAPQPSGARIWKVATTTDQTYTDGSTFQARTKLPAGTYRWQFEFYWGGAPHWANPSANPLITATPATPTGKQITVDPTGRFMMRSGAPWFYLADTGWLVAQSLAGAELATYLDNRRAKGFNVIQCTGAAWGASAPKPAPDGSLPFLNNNPATPNPAFWSYVDTLLSMAEDRDMVIALVPCWYDFVTGALKQVNASNAKAFGQWLGTRYASRSNLIWVLGGDCAPAGYEGVYSLLAEGLNEGSGNKHLLTFHPNGNHTSSQYLPGAGWLDLYMIQTNHAIDWDDSVLVGVERAAAPIRPVIAAETRYEHFMPWSQKGRRLDDHQIRKSVWSTFLSCVCGFGYGAAGVFQFARVPDPEWSSVYTWTEAMDLPGAACMAHFRSFVDSVAWWKLVPGGGLVTFGGGDQTGDKVYSARADDYSFGVVYMPENGDVEVSLVGFSGNVKAQWYDPRTGAYRDIGTFVGGTKQRWLTPPGTSDPDWVLVLKRL